VPGRKDWLRLAGLVILAALIAVIVVAALATD
jgi:hypothetical protein